MTHGNIISIFLKTQRIDPSNPLCTHGRWSSLPEGASQDLMDALNGIRRLTKGIRLLCLEAQDASYPNIALSSSFSFLQVILWCG